MNNFNKIMVIILVLMLALASVVAPHWLSSTVFMIVYLVFALLFLLSVFMIPDLFLKLLHFLFAVLIVCFILVKGFNDRSQYTFAKDADYQIYVLNDTLSITLVDFTVQKGGNDRIPDNYVSDLVINDQEIELSVNHPYAYKKSRFYQSAYGSIQSFIFCSSEDTLSLFPGQDAQFDQRTVRFLEYDPLMGRVALNIDGNLTMMSLADRSALLYILPGESVEASIIDYVEVKGLGLMAVLGALCIVLIIFVRFRSL